MRPLILCCGLALLSACESSDPPGPPLTEEAYTTLQALWNPLMPPPATQAMLDAGELSSFDHPLFDSLGLLGGCGGNFGHQIIDFI